jgi:hypothetical protein
MILLFETVRELLMADDLHGLRLHATPVCRLVSDDLGGRKIDRWYLSTEQAGLRPVDARNAWILPRTKGAVHDATSFELLVAIEQVSCRLSLLNTGHRHDRLFL